MKRDVFVAINYTTRTKDTNYGKTLFSLLKSIIIKEEIDPLQIDDWKQNTDV